MRFATLRALACVLLAPSIAFAQAGAYPSKPVRLIVPFLAGAAPDTIARLVGQELATRLGQPFLVENRTGAAGNVAAEFVAKSPADGYTLFAATDAPLVINPHVYRKQTVDPVKDFTPISIVARSGFFIVVCPKLPLATMDDLAAYAKRNPVSYASSGYGSNHHLLGEMIKQRGGYPMTHVPYKGAAQAMTEILSCNVDVGVGAVGTVLPAVVAGKMKAIAITTARRNPSVPDVPTLSESGFPGVEMEAFYGLLAPAGTPRAIVEKLHASVVESLKSKALVDRFRELGLTIVGNTPEEFAATIASDSQKYARLAREAKLEAE